MPDFHQGPFNNVFILSPIKIEFSYKEWLGKYVVLEYDFSGGKRGTGVVRNKWFKKNRFIRVNQTIL
jgi:hypothetical protein